MKEFRTRVLLSSVFFLSGLIGGCVTTMTDPIGPDSSLVIGRVVINNRYPGRLGLMPMGTVERGITLQIKNTNQTLLIKVITGRGGYFVIPNIPAIFSQFLSRHFSILYSQSSELSPERALPPASCPAMHRALCSLRYAVLLEED